MTQADRDDPEPALLGGGEVTHAGPQRTLRRLVRLARVRGHRGELAGPAISELILGGDAGASEVVVLRGYGQLDPKKNIGNLFFDQDRVGFLDWGVIKASTPLTTMRRIRPRSRASLRERRAGSA